uniref:Cytochrome b561 domain-containing protein n=1 Tax=Parastrongyloides trichosuri TaxID=131310 RepID=A0A0N5A770_PARTI
MSALLFTTIGMIAILVSHNFYWTGPRIGGKENTSPKSFHALFGVLSYGLLVVQVLNPLLRCGPNERNRIYFNWIHRILGMTSFLLATGTITIAAKFFGKHFTDPKNAEIMLYVFYGIIVLCVLINEMSLRLKLRKTIMFITLIVLFVFSIVVCSYISALIITAP